MENIQMIKRGGPAAKPSDVSDNAEPLIGKTVDVPFTFTERETLKKILVAVSKDQPVDRQMRVPAFNLLHRIACGELAALAAAAPARPAPFKHGAGRSIPEGTSMSEIFGGPFGGKDFG
jgi:hypothetical protein